MAEFEQVEFTDNVLNRYQSYSYHLSLVMINPLNIDMYMDDAGAIKAEDQIVIAQTGSTTLLSIDGLDVQTLMSFGAGARDALGATGQFVIYEPVTFNFYKSLSMAAQDLGLKDVLLAQYILTVRFTTSPGDEDELSGDLAGSFSWPIKITSVASSYGSGGEGSQHICNWIEVGFKDLRDDLKLKKGIQIDGASNFGDAIKALELKLYEQEYDDIQSSTPTRGVTDVYKIRINYEGLSDSYWIDEKYKRYMEDGESVVLAPTFSFKQGSSISGIIKTLWQATKTNEKILNDIKEQKAKAKAIQKVAAAGNFDQAAKMSGGDKTAGKNKSYRLKYYTLNTNVKSTMFDDTRNDFALFWDITLDEYTVMDHRNDTKTEPEAESIKNIEEKSKTGNLNKFYRYQFTGLNTDVINLDIKFNALYYVASAPYGGMLGTSGGTTQSAATLSPEKKQKVGVGPDGSVSVVVRNPKGTGGAANLGMGALKATNPTFQVVTIEPKARQYRAPKEDLPIKFAEEFTANTDGGRNNTLTRNSGTLLTSKGSDDDNKTSKTQDSNYQLMNLENVTDLVEIELEIRGDPYWFGRPRKVTNAKQQNIKTKHPDYFKGAAYFLLDTRFGDEYSDDGLIHTDQLDMFAGLYMVTTVTASFNNGVFTQFLKSLRQLQIKNNVISKLLLAVDSTEPREYYDDEME